LFWTPPAIFGQCYGPVQAPPLRETNAIIARIKCRAAQRPSGTWIVEKGPTTAGQFELGARWTL